MASSNRRRWQHPRGNHPLGFRFVAGRTYVGSKHLVLHRSDFELVAGVADSLTILLCHRRRKPAHEMPEFVEQWNVGVGPADIVELGLGRSTAVE